MADKITWADKESLVTDPTIAEKNKVTDNNMNEIKNAVNNNADQLDETIVIGDENITSNSRGVINESEYIPYINSEIAIGSTNPYNQRTWFKQGKNLFNQNVITKNKFYYITNNAIVDNPNWNMSDFIAVKPNEKYTLSCQTDSNNMQFNYSYYNASKSLLGGEGSTTTKEITYTIPSNAVYIRIGYRNDQSATNIQLEKGSTATTYEAYVNPSIIIDDRTMYGKEKLYGTTLWENASGTHESFTLNDDIKNYDEIEITFGRSSWTVMRQKVKYVPASSGTTPCGLTIMYPASNGTALIVANAVMEIGSNGTSVSFPRMTSGFIQNENGYVVESGSYLNVYKVVGYK